MFEAPYAPSEEAARAALLAAAPAPQPSAAPLALDLAQAAREGGGPLAVEEILRGWPLSTREGLALMALAEALLRVPDDATADALIAEKLAEGDWRHHAEGFASAASGWALAMGARLVGRGETPGGVLAPMVKRLGVPTVRNAARQAVRLMGGQFVLGETIQAALARAAKAPPNIRHSYDMLGEGARTAADARKYLGAYHAACEAIGRAAQGSLPARPGLSVKLSAIHPRYEAVSRDRVMAELLPALIGLAQAARAHDLNLTLDAEEADRLELSLELFDRLLTEPSLSGWEGLGLAVQAYQKRAGAVVSWLADRSAATGRRLMVRLVKGAYWDAEIKRTQERGLDDFPVWTRKAATDLAWLTHAAALLDVAKQGRIFPQLATHNAASIAEALALAEAKGVNPEKFEFQRLHGMGGALYGKLAEKRPDVALRIYAPVGVHEDLLAYLVRRLLENGANGGFVAAVADESVSFERLLRHPSVALAEGPPRHPRVKRPAALFGDRPNSRGVEFGDRRALAALIAARDAAPSLPQVPAQDPAAAVARAQAAFPAWNAMPVAQRAAVLRKAADGLEANSGKFIAAIQEEGFRTLDDALSELREAVDFCRYYADAAERLGTPTALPGPVGESNLLSLSGRGVFLCISPWNFPLAIFLGQVTAALVAGNAVVAKPAPQTPRIAGLAAQALRAAGLPDGVLELVPGGPEVGAALVAHPAIAGIAFTGSTATARGINRVLAAKEGPIIPFIAETGGLNAMVVDATALPEQVTDDVLTSAFRSAGQRCSALRLLCVQAEAADGMLAMIAGAARELKLGDPRDPATHVGPLIDAAAKARIAEWLANLPPGARETFRHPAEETGNFLAPRIVELRRVEDLTQEVFGPVLHVVRWRGAEEAALLRALAGTGYGLTLGVQSRRAGFAARVAAAVPAGNVYVNRNMVGAVVGSQPFGGQGLSGTGPKAGGPHYLPRFMQERVVTVNTAAAGGDAALLAEGE
ncbi:MULTISPECIES: L-glutamate gamma-semialdehyde dehydrogenase [Roseomonadaceae]|uniref:Bifunctional protein PutA n=1 Tax=Falsiroseomonas oleicola TaxID=2801474 RepID=A0ABS6H7E8_9PROT|nr:L-glutamate gamma-semialdehyde dehydrogenase [Roseomonas oleicola]MBU8544625.1 L-glutamate gamma-semialdehyde dehydrogenase [Roseomonas oleicola]